MNPNTYLHWLIHNTATEFWHDSADPVELRLALNNGAVGATTNPFLAAVALEKNRAAWSEELNAVAAKGLAPERQAEELTGSIVARIAAMCQPLYVQTQGWQGLVCAQVNPSHAGDREAMRSMARRFHRLAPNISVKLPATAAGLDVLEDCIADGISATATVSFTVPQVIAIAERCRVGCRRAAGNGVVPGRCFAVLMIGRLDDYLREVATDNHSALSESDIRQAGLAVTKRAYAIYQERRYEAVLMVAALRGSYHLTELAGARLIVTVAPAPQQWFISEDHAREPRIERDISPAVIDRLSALPEFRKAYEPDGMNPDGFISYGATQRTLSQYTEAGWKLLEEFRWA
jgi:transaldolase